MGHSMIEVFVWSFTEQIRPLASGLVSSTLPNGHDPRGALGSTTRTTSPMLKFFLAFVHFCLSWSSRRYSCVLLCQKRSAIYWTCFQRRLTLRSDLWKVPGGRIGCVFSRRMWFGVNGSRSCGSEDAVERGRLLRIDSTSQKMESGVKHLTDRSYESLPDSAIVWGSWRIEAPLVSIRKQSILDLPLV